MIRICRACYPCTALLFHKVFASTWVTKDSRTTLLAHPILTHQHRRIADIASLFVWVTKPVLVPREENPFQVIGADTRALIGTGKIASTEKNARHEISREPSKLALRTLLQNFENFEKI